MSAKRISPVLLVVLAFLITSCGARPGDSEDIAPACPYSLPFEAEAGEYITTQANLSSNPRWSHAEGEAAQYAFDFGLPNGTPVLAARAGIVSAIKRGSTSCGGEDMAAFGNFVIVDHGDGTFAYYGHLRPEIPVERGDKVKQGQLIGSSGNSGYTNCGSGRNRGYHLHFQLQETGNNFDDSIPITCFEEVEGNIPQEGTILVPGPVIPEIGGYVSGQEQAGGSEALPEGEIAYLTQHESGSMGIDAIKLGEGKAYTIIASPQAIRGFSWSPNGSMVAYVLESVSGDGDYLEVFEPLTMTGGITIVWPKASPAGPVFSPTYYGYADPSWSADGRYVYFLADDGRVVGFRLWRATVETFDRQELLSNRGSFSFDVSGANGKIVLTEWFNGYNGFGMFLVSQNGEIAKTLFDPKDMHSFDNPDWSPNGKLIAFEASDPFVQGPFEPAGIWIVNSDASGLKLLVADGKEPDWSPDGNWIAYALWDGNQRDIWITNVNGDLSINITNTPNVSETSPNWRP